MYNIFMDKRLLAHEKFMKNAVKRLEDLLDNSRSENHASIIKGAKTLHDYHCEMVKNFQHERLIHLLVTLFFAGMQILFIAGTILLAVSPIIGTDAIVINTSMIFIDITLAITGVFYVKHYYSLENGVQRLYKFSDKLYEIINK